MNWNFPMWLAHCNSFNSLAYLVSCGIFFECTHFESSPYFFMELLSMPSNLSGYRNFSAQLLGLIDLLKEISINAAACSEVAKWFELHLNLMGGKRSHQL